MNDQPLSLEQQRPVMDSKCSGHMVIPMLEFLNGLPWCDKAKSYVSALRPSSVRICRNGCDLMAVNWRVTVWLNEDDTIKRIEQECAYNIYGEITYDERGIPETPYGTQEMRHWLEECRKSLTK